jgi:hypothetical protein
VSATIPPAIRRFVLTSIASVPHLEALLLLRSAEPDAWPAARVADRLYIGEGAALKLLDDLCNARMTERRGDAYVFAPHSQALRGTIDELAEVYARHLVDITHLIHSRIDRQAQHFADAFRWRKDS